MLKTKIFKFTDYSSSLVEQKKTIELAEQDRAIAIAEKSRAQSEAKADADQARAQAVKAEEEVITVSVYFNKLNVKKQLSCNCKRESRKRCNCDYCSC